jgi:hypothetical protein
MEKSKALEVPLSNYLVCIINSLTGSFPTWFFYVVVEIGMKVGLNLPARFRRSYRVVVLLYTYWSYCIGTNQSLGPVSFGCYIVGWILISFVFHFICVRILSLLVSLGNLAARIQRNFFDPIIPAL